MESSNGFLTYIWGPVGWMFLHMITLNFDLKRKKSYFHFFKSLEGVLPCGACRENYKKLINGKNKKYNLTMDKMESRESISYWLFIVHNKIQKHIYQKTNLKKNKPEYNDTKEDFMKAMSKYEKYRAKCNKSDYGCVRPAEYKRKYKCKVSIDY